MPVLSAKWQSKIEPTEKCVLAPSLVTVEAAVPPADDPLMS